MAMRYVHSSKSSRSAWGIETEIGALQPKICVHSCFSLAWSIATTGNMAAHLKSLEVHVILVDSALPPGSPAVVCNLLLVRRIQPGSMNAVSTSRQQGYRRPIAMSRNDAMEVCYMHLLA